MSTGDNRRILLVAHPRRQEATAVALGVVDRLHDAGIGVVMAREEADALGLSSHHGVTVAEGGNPARGCELVCVLGGDGTILRGAEVSRGSGAPLLGVNLGRLGFLTCCNADQLENALMRFARRDYLAESRMALHATAVDGDGRNRQEWRALNDFVVVNANVFELVCKSAFIG